MEKIIDKKESNELTKKTNFQNIDDIKSGLGVVYEDERLCCESKRCCKKRRCCKATVICSLIGDLLTAITIVVAYTAFIVYIKKYGKSNDDIAVARKYILQMFLSYWAYSFVQIYKVFAGIRWICRQSRQHFVSYYRWTLTFGIS